VLGSIQRLGEIFAELWCDNSLTDEAPGEIDNSSPPPCCKSARAEAAPGGTRLIGVRAPEDVTAALDDRAPAAQR